MTPSLFASAHLYGRTNSPFTGKPRESRDAPVPIVLEVPSGLRPSFRILLLLCEPFTVMFHPKRRESMICALSTASSPQFRTDATLARTVRFDGAADAAIGTLIKASFVCFR